MTLSSGKVVHEMITADEMTKTVIFKHHHTDDVFRGFVINMVFEEEGEVFLNYTMNWYYKAGEGEDIQAAFQDNIKKAVMKAKEIAEAA
jgi:hypothetical protein